MHKQTFTTRILLFLFIIIPIPLILNLGIFTFFSFSESLDSLELCFQTHATNLSLEIRKVLSFKKLFLERLSNAIAIKELTIPHLEDSLFSTVSSELAEISDSFNLCLLDSKTGKVWAKNITDPFIITLTKENSLRSKLFRYSGMTFITEITDNQNKASTPYIVIVEEIDTPKNGLSSSSLSGFLISFQKLQVLQKELFQNITLAHGDILLINQHGEVLLSSSKCFLNNHNSSYAFECSLPHFPEIKATKSEHPLFIRKLKFMENRKLVGTVIEGKHYLGFLLDKLPIANTYTLSLIPLSSFLLTTLRLPVIILLFYMVTFSLMAILLVRLNKKVSKPLQELTTCMEAAWKGNYNVRFEPDKYGYEVNDLGNVFNCTLLRLLISMEKADKELRTNQALQHELALLQSLQNSLLSTHYTFTDKVKKFTDTNHTFRQRGFFEGWVTRTEEGSSTHLIGALGCSSDEGLPSYLYALSAKSLFIAQAQILSDLSQIGHKVFANLSELIPDHSVSYIIFDFDLTSLSVSISFFGKKEASVFIRKAHVCEEIIDSTILSLSPNDAIIVIHTNSSLTLNPEKTINPFLSDSLHPVQGQELLEVFEETLKDRNIHDHHITLYQIQ